MRVLLVEDDEPVAESLTRGLGRYGFEVEWVRTGAEALRAQPSDLVLVDLGLPDMDGLDVCRELRARGDVPIIVISARADETDRVVGLEIGADDYVSKPFGVREVVARIRAVLRRVRPTAVQPEPTQSSRLSIDRRARRVYVEGAEMSLTPKEYDLLAFLAEAPGAVFTREQIMEAVWDANWFGPTKTLDVHVGALRRKLGDAVAVETVRGVGYRRRLRPRWMCCPRGTPPSTRCHSRSRSTTRRSPPHWPAGNTCGGSTRPRSAPTGW